VLSFYYRYKAKIISLYASYNDFKLIHVRKQNIISCRANKFFFNLYTHTLTHTHTHTELTKIKY